MKKFMVILIFAVAATGIIGCGDTGDDSKADIKWKNGLTTDSVHDITWTGATASTTWNEGTTNLLAAGLTNNFKGVKDLTGESSCIAASDGNDYTITVQGDADGGSYTVPENSAEILVIDSITVKKK